MVSLLKPSLRFVKAKSPSHPFGTKFPLMFTNCLWLWFRKLFMNILETVYCWITSLGGPSDLVFLWKPKLLALLHMIASWYSQMLYKQTNKSPWNSSANKCCICALGGDFSVGTMAWLPKAELLRVDTQLQRDPQDGALTRTCLFLQTPHPVVTDVASLVELSWRRMNPFVRIHF